MARFTVEKLRRLFVFDRNGLLVWLCPPKQHPRMKGKPAGIAVNKHQITIGTFDSPDAAESAYRSARVQHFGAFA